MIYGHPSMKHYEGMEVDQTRLDHLDAARRRHPENFHHRDSGRLGRRARAGCSCRFCRMMGRERLRYVRTRAEVDAAYRGVPYFVPRYGP